jgi:hypothetical protein
MKGSEEPADEREARDDGRCWWYVIQGSMMIMSFTTNSL